MFLGRCVYCLLLWKIPTMYRPVILHVRSCTNKEGRRLRKESNTAKLGTPAILLFQKEP